MTKKFSVKRWNKYTNIWLMNLIAGHNFDVCVPVDENGQIFTFPFNGNKWTYLFNPLNHLNHTWFKAKTVIMPFWEVIKEVQGISLAGTDYLLSRDAVLTIYQKEFEEYVGDKNLLKGWAEEMKEWQKYASKYNK